METELPLVVAFELSANKFAELVITHITAHGTQEKTPTLEQLSFAAAGVDNADQFGARFYPSVMGDLADNDPLDSILAAIQQGGESTSECDCGCGCAGSFTLYIGVIALLVELARQDVLPAGNYVISSG